MLDDFDDIRALEALAEKAYDAMYEAHSPGAAGACYSDTKEYFHDAIGIARRLKAIEVVTRLEARLAHVKAVFRSQFI